MRSRIGLVCFGMYDAISGAPFSGDLPGYDQGKRGRERPRSGRLWRAQTHSLAAATRGSLPPTPRPFGWGLSAHSRAVLRHFCTAFLQRVSANRSDTPNKPGSRDVPPSGKLITVV